MMNNQIFTEPKLDVLSKKDADVVKPSGQWMARTSQQMEDLTRNALEKKYANQVIIDLSEFQSFDIAGLWIIHQLMEALKNKGKSVAFEHESDAFRDLSTRIESYKPEPQKIKKPSFYLFQKLVDLGETSLILFYLAQDLIVFLGQVVSGLASIVVHPRRFRMVSVISHMEKIGFDAIPIVSVMSMALGIVLAYQGEEQLRRFGAEIYTINLVSISIFREVGILITAILVAGRSGSAITAEIGIMKINQEIDALNTLGLSPMNVLILPRVLAIILVMPLLAFIADIAGLIGGGIMVVLSLDVSTHLYIQRVGEAVTIGSFWVGLLKAPFFGAIIGIVSCFEGMRVKGTAESVGKCTTQSVVEGIFLVTLADALLSVFFSKIGI